MKYLIIILLFSSCSILKDSRTYKAYQRVAADPFVDQRESVLLSQKCLTVYPFIRDTPRIVSVGVDSLEYEAAVKSYNELLDSMIVLYERMDQLAVIDTTATLPVNYVTRPQDSLRVIRNFLRLYKPPRIVRTEVKEVPIINTAWEAQKQIELEACRAEKAQLYQDNQKIATKLQNRNASRGWILGGGLLLAILSFFAGKIIRK